MIFIHSDLSTKNIEKINKYVEEGKDVFILIYMEGCGPCMATRPEWEKITNMLESKYKSNNNIVIADVDKDLLPSLKYIGNIDGFPTMKHISNKGKIVEVYENVALTNKDRSVNSFVEWIEKKVNKNIPYSSPNDLMNRLSNLSNTKSKKNKKRYNSRSRSNSSNKYLKQRGGKWTLKYKRSINCKRPKGFSQKQYCKRKNR